MQQMPSKEYKWHEKRDPKILASSKRTYLPFIFSSYHHRFSSLLNLLCNLLPWILTFILSNTHKQTVAIDTRSKVMSLSLKIKNVCCFKLQSNKTTISTKGRNGATYFLLCVVRYDKKTTKWSDQRCTKTKPTWSPFNLQTNQQQSYHHVIMNHSTEQNKLIKYQYQISYWLIFSHAKKGKKNTTKLILWYSSFHQKQIKLCRYRLCILCSHPLS